MTVDLRLPELRKMLEGLNGRPVADWPQEAFDRLDIMNPFTTGNMKLWRRAVDLTRSLGGTVVECGTYRGQSIAPLAKLMKEAGDPRPVYGVDSFEGFPDLAPEDLVNGKYVGRETEFFTRTSYEQVQSLMTLMNVDDKVTLIKGFFEDSLPSAPFEQISVLILDCDLYDSYKTCLTSLYDKVLPTGWIIFDEYFSPRFPGARIAIDEFFADKPEKPTLDTILLAENPYERWYVIKQ